VEEIHMMITSCEFSFAMAAPPQYANIQTVEKKEVKEHNSQG